MTTAYLIHGTSTRDDDWFPWLEEALAPAVKLERLWLPDPFAPMQAAWDSALEDQIKPADGLTLVAHSLGCVTALRYLARHPEIKGANLVLVGAFVDPLPTYPSLDAYMAGELDLKEVGRVMGRVSRMLCKKGNFARMNWQF
ncbi:putative esterase [Limosilactobacillus fermentum F-6]|nr:putative esterase [Limosilactobacillus fermentum F-6]